MPNQKPMAALIRENEILIDIVIKAIRLRNMGKLDDQVDEEMRVNTNGRLGRSGTIRMMHDQAFDTAMKDFDESILDACEKGMEWADTWKSVKPVEVKTQPTE